MSCLSDSELNKNGLASLYELKDDLYFASPRVELMDLIDRNGLKVLDFGCGSGETGKSLLATGKASWVTGIELMPERGKIASSVLNDVHVGNIEEMDFGWTDDEFDCFVFGDVLEHLANPWKLLRRLRPLLAENGMVVASIPNIRYLPVVSSLLLCDDWQYMPSGVLDFTHLRFFTRKTAVHLFTDTGYSVELIQPAFNGRRYSIPNRLTFGKLAGFLAVQWLIRAKS